MCKKIFTLLFIFSVVIILLTAGICGVTQTRLALISTNPTAASRLNINTDVINGFNDSITTIEDQTATVSQRTRRHRGVASTTISTPTIPRATTTPVITTPPPTIPPPVILPPTIPTTTPVIIPPPTAPSVNPMKTMAWIYPGNPTCAASTEFADGRKIDVLKSEFFTINGGALRMLTTENSYCNGYSLPVIALLKLHSTEQYSTVSSGNTDDMDTFLVQALTPQSTDIATLVNFTTSNNLTGIELDFEGFSSWSPESYSNYKSFVTLLGDALHAKGKKLMIDGPAVTNDSEEKWFLWRYSDFTSLPVDSMVIMAYDYQFDYGVGTPVAPLNWLKNIIVWTSTKYPKDKITIGLPSYGYQGTSGTYNSIILTAEQAKAKSGYATAVRDASSGEMTWKSGTTIYFYQDATSLDLKRKVVAGQGINSISIWHLGGNPWFQL